MDAASSIPGAIPEWMRLLPPEWALRIREVQDAEFACGEWTSDDAESFDAVNLRAVAATWALAHAIHRLLVERDALRAQLRGKAFARLTPRPDAERGVIGVLPSLERDAEPEPHLTQPARLGGTHP